MTGLPAQLSRCVSGLIVGWFHLLQATQAYVAGQKALAKELGSKGRWHADQMRAAHSSASETIFNQRNAGGRPASQQGGLGAVSSHLLSKQRLMMASFMDTSGCTCPCSTGCITSQGVYALQKCVPMWEMSWGRCPSFSSVTQTIPGFQTLTCLGGCVVSPPPPPDQDMPCALGLWTAYVKSQLELTLACLDREV